VNTSKAILSFGITSPVQAQGIIDEAAKTVTIAVPYGTDRTAMTAAITHSGASVSPASGAAVNFTGPQTYTVSAADGSTQAYTVTVVLGGISGESDLAAIGGSAPLDGDYQLTGDLVLSGWTPVGTSGSPFTGTFDGNGHTVTITGFDSSTRAGLFGTTDGAEIKDLDIVLSGVTTEAAAKQVGGAAGVAYATTFENVTVSGSMTNNTSNADIGGLVGQFHLGGRIYRCSSEVDITANFSTGGSAGGLVGLVPSGSLSIEECYATGDIVFTANAGMWQNFYVGGLVGFAQNGAQAGIQNCYAAGDLTVCGSNSSVNAFLIGGLIGHVWGGSHTIENCYASGTVKDETAGAENRVGGLFGRLESASAFAIHNAALSPSITTAAGTSFRVVDENSGVLTGNIANSVMTINAAAVTGGAANNQNGEDKSPAELQSQATYTALGWDFATVWKMNTAAPYYPILRWQE
jgi:hypothetical protein